MPKKYIPKYVTATEKACGACHEVKPLTEFTRAPTNVKGLGYKDFCKACHRQKRDDENAKKQQTALERKMELEAEAKMRAAIIESKTKEILTEHLPKPSPRERIAAPHVSEVLEAVMSAMKQKFGADTETALQVLARVLVDCIASAMEEHKGGIAVQRYMALLQQMIKASTEHRQSAPDVAEFYDETEIWQSVAEKALPAMPVPLLETQIDRFSDEALIAEYHRRNLHLTVVNEPAP